MHKLVTCAIKTIVIYSSIRHCGRRCAFINSVAAENIASAWFSGDVIFYYSSLERKNIQNKMDQSFQNIFEKYNIVSEVPKKRYKAPKTLKQSYTFSKKELEVEKCSFWPKTAAGRLSASVLNTGKSSNLKSSCFFNTSTKGKYYIPTRYKTLDIIAVESGHQNVNCPVTEKGNVGICKGECSSKENCGEQNSASFGHISCKKLEIQPDCLTEVRAINFSRTNINTVANGCISNCTKNRLSDSLNITKCKQKRKNCNAFENQKKFEWNALIDSDNFPRKSFYSFESSVPKPSNTNEGHTVTKPDENTSTELDLLIDLIEREENNNVEGYKQKEKIYCDDLSFNKTCFKGGYEELFERALKQERVKSSFLKYDKKIGLRTGELLTVVKIETSYGLTLATVKSEDLNKNFAIAVTQEMAPRLKLDAKIEAFFDEKTLPYKMQLNGECLDVYLEPYKLLIV